MSASTKHSSFIPGRDGPKCLLEPGLAVEPRRQRRKVLACQSGRLAQPLDELGTFPFVYVLDGMAKLFSNGLSN